MAFIKIGEEVIERLHAMYKLILMAFLTVCCSSVEAEWIKVGSGKTQTNYIENSSVYKKGYGVTMSVLFDFYITQKINNVDFLSLIEKDEFNCKKPQWRKLYVATFTEHMGNG